MKSIFNDYQKKLSDIVLENNTISPLSELYSNEIKELAVIWSYYSGKIEGNTYSFVETETLLKDGITSAKRFEDAKMLKNLYNTFISELHYIKSGNKEVIDKRFLMQMHSQLLDELVDDRERGIIRKRAVRIAGSDYVPPASAIEIEEQLDRIIEEQALLSNPLERAVYLHCNIAKLQPFIDGNKRTSRLTESVVLMNEDIIPIFSTSNLDINDYRTGILYFYETGEYTQYADYFLKNKLKYLQKYTDKVLLN
jgi:filamentation induced by cAMP protein fic